LSTHSANFSKLINPQHISRSRHNNVHGKQRKEEGGAILKFLRASLRAAVFDLTVAGVTRPTEEDPPLLPPPRGPSAPDFNGVFSDLEWRGDDFAFNSKIKIWFCHLPLKFIVCLLILPYGTYYHLFLSQSIS
jgi:hypothetical protein